MYYFVWQEQTEDQRDIILIKYTYLENTRYNYIEHYNLLIYYSTSVVRNVRRLSWTPDYCVIRRL